MSTFDPLALVLESSGPTDALRRVEARLRELHQRQQNATLAENLLAAFDLAIEIADLHHLRAQLLRVAGPVLPSQHTPWPRPAEDEPLAPAAEPLPPTPSPLRGGGARTSSSPSPLRGGGWGEGSLPSPSAQAEPEEPAASQQAADTGGSFRFLGRGVSGRLGDHHFDVEALERSGFPFLAHPAMLAEQLGITCGQLRWLAFHAEAATQVHYVQFAVPRRSGGTRTLSRPLRLLDAVQHWILGRILSRLPTGEPCHGFVPGRSIVTNARPHAGQAVVINLDLENFFPSVTFPRVRRVFERVGYSPAVATVLALLCTECPRRAVTLDEQVYFVATGPRGLPQGACTSPALANQAAFRLDRRLSGFASRMGLVYTRYADDLTFSGPDAAAIEAGLGYVLSFVERIVLDEGFTVNAKKTRVLRRHTRQTVTGLVVNARPAVPRKQVRRLRAILHRARREGLEAQNREGRPHFRAWLMGKIAYVRMVRPEVGEKLLRELLALPENDGEAG